MKDDLAPCRHVDLFASDKGVRCWRCHHWWPLWKMEGRTVDFQEMGDGAFVVFDGVLS